mgnify:CR=1 FL=1
MRIFDENDKEMQEYDPALGYVQEDRLLIKHHEAIEVVQEQGHYEVIAEYENGGKDVEWIVDVPAVEAKEAYDEYEDILRYTPFTAKELAEHRIAELKGKLSATDYNILKVVEGATTLSAVAEVVKQRAAWRREINELEKTAGGDS